MAERQVAPKADQPRVSTGELSRMDKPASMQYRTEGIKSYSGRSTPRNTRKGRQ